MFEQTAVHASCHVSLQELTKNHTIELERIRNESKRQCEAAIAAYKGHLQTQMLYIILWMAWALFAYAILSYGWTIVWLPYEFVHNWLFNCLPTVYECKSPAVWRNGRLVRQELFGILHIHCLSHLVPFISHFLSICYVNTQIEYIPMNELSPMTLESLDRQGFTCHDTVCSGCSWLLCSLQSLIGGSMTLFVYSLLMMLVISTIDRVPKYLRQQIRDIELRYEYESRISEGNAGTRMKAKRSDIEIRLQRTKPRIRPLTGPYCTCWSAKKDTDSSCTIA
jgi:hypothetical protein